MREHKTTVLKNTFFINIGNIGDVADRKINDVFISDIWVFCKTQSPLLLY